MTTNLDVKVKQVLDVGTEPEDSGHDDCYFCEAARRMVEIPVVGHIDLDGRVVELENKQLVRIKSG